MSFTATLVDETSAPKAGAGVTLLRGSSSTPIASGVTDTAGHVVLRTTRPLGTTTWHAVFAGDSTHAPADSGPLQVRGIRYSSVLTITGAARILDENQTPLTVTWKASDDTPVAGSVSIQRRLLDGPWAVVRRLRTSASGRATFPVAPRVDSTWRAVGVAGSWWFGDVSHVKRLDNVPRGTPVAYPAKAPRPAYTGPQARAVGTGANSRISGIPDAVWRSMVGRSWHRGCPVGRENLRLLRINYWGFDGYRYRGEMVLGSAVVGRAAGALRDMYDGRFPIRRMYRVDRFGWSPRLHGANDYASMRADNTSGFNCRSVVNKPGVLSPHARGRAVDVNTWENPYRSATGLVPNSWWASRSHPRVAWRSASHPVVRIWRSHGFRWTYGNGDSQHLDGRTASLSSGSFTG